MTTKFDIKAHRERMRKILKTTTAPVPGADRQNILQKLLGKKQPEVKQGLGE
ncbi:hypothetical protein ES703_108502 [subsurface metagenome]